MPTILITGANRGIGKELAALYEEDGWRVISTCRHPAQAKGVAGEVLPLDVTDPDSVADLKAELGNAAIDVLWNNAGVYLDKGSEPGSINYNDWEETLRVNTLGPIRVAEAFMDNVAVSNLRIMAFTSTRVGSIGDNTSGGSYAYRTSKTALNMAVKNLSVDLAPRRITCMLLHPGWVRTDLGGPNGLIDARTGAMGMKGVVDEATVVSHMNHTGRFFNYTGEDIPW